MARKDKIARSVTSAITKPADVAAQRSFGRIIKAFFTVYSIHLHQHAPDLFGRLRGHCNIDDESYVASFTLGENDKEGVLKTEGPMGYSGSTFFTTLDGKYLIKSIPRHFENSFFRGDLLQPYVDYMNANLSSMLIRITDFLAVDHAYKLSPGILFGFAPSHHLVMENLLVGQEEGERRARNELSQHDRTYQGPEDRDIELWKWETWDLKPTTYFFPERDIAQGKLASEATKSRLADEFNDRIVLTKSQARTFIDQIKRDTQLLANVNAVDYSLFLVRIPIPASQQTPIAGQDGNQEDPFSDNAAHPVIDGSTSAEAQRPPDVVPTPENPPFTPPHPPSWRTGVKSSDGKHVYRAAILDFFWAKHKMHAKMMTLLVNTWNKIDLGGDNGPMSITTSSEEYRERFIRMCQGYIEANYNSNDELDD